MKEANEIKSAKTAIKNTIEMKKKRYFNCGHKSDSYQDKEKDRKCFNCDQFGHISADCLQSKRTSTKKRVSRTKR